MNRIPFATVILITLSISNLGCNGSKNRSGVAAVGSQGYILTSQPINRTVLQVGENAVFEFSFTAHEEIFLDRVATRFESNSNAIKIQRLEMREGSNLTTLPNSIVAFGTPPTFPLETSIVMNRLVRQGETITFAVIADLQQVGTNNTLQMKLVNVFGRANFRGVDIDPLPSPIIGSTLES